jgi:Protein of unknown function (DUF2690)
MVSRTARRFVTMTLATLLLTAGVVAVVESPAAAAGCSRSTCTGHDPYAMGCSKGSHKTVSAMYQGVTVVRITNWYSPNCVANWAEGSLTTEGVSKHLRVTLQAFKPDYSMYMCYFNATQSNKGNTQESCESPFYNKSVNAWTDMIDGTGQICVQAVFYTDNGLWLGSTTDDNSQRCQ